jgi:hypothetical protein
VDDLMAKGFPRKGAKSQRRKSIAGKLLCRYVALLTHSLGACPFPPISFAPLRLGAFAWKQEPDDPVSRNGPTFVGLRNSARYWFGAAKRVGCVEVAEA